MHFDRDAHSADAQQRFVSLRQAVFGGLYDLIVTGGPAVAEAFIHEHLLGVMCPAFGEGIAGEDFFQPVGR